MVRIPMTARTQMSCIRCMLALLVLCVRLSGLTACCRKMPHFCHCRTHPRLPARVGAGGGAGRAPAPPRAAWHHLRRHSGVHTCQHRVRAVSSRAGCHVYIVRVCLGKQGAQWGGRARRRLGVWCLASKERTGYSSRCAVPSTDQAVPSIANDSLTSINVSLSLTYNLPSTNALQV